MSDQMTLNGSAVLSESTLKQYLEDWKWSIREVAEEFDVPEKDVKHAIKAHGIDYDRHATGASAAGAAKVLWEMDPDDLSNYTRGGESA